MRSAYPDASWIPTASLPETMPTCVVFSPYDGFRATIFVHTKVNYEFAAR